MIERPTYLDYLNSLRDKQIIKVLTGVRRCGKSTILDMFQAKLLAEHIDDSQISALNFEDLANEKYLDYQTLYQYLNDRLVEGKMNYIFLDEIQRVKDFEKAIDSLFIKKNVDLYVTGSNAMMLSGELATLISGRYIEIKVYPLSFKEVYSYYGIDKEKTFQRYFNYGGFPFALQTTDDKSFNGYIEGIINTVLVKDVLNRKKRSDAMLVEMLAKFLTETTGNLINIKKIADTLTSNGQKTTGDTVASYIKAFEESFLFYRCNRFDIAGKKHLNVNSKYYVVDPSFRSALLGQKRLNLSNQLESIVYMELLRRGYELYTGVIDNYEVDFVAIKDGVKEYYQVSYSVVDENTYERELRSLKEIEDNYRKILLTTDAGNYNDEGIEQINVVDWLLDI